MTDPVNHPPHYKGANGIETIDVIEAFGLGFHLGNVLKYVLRAGRKNGSTLEDLKKARWYLDREIARARPGQMSVVEPVPAPKDWPPKDWHNYKGGGVPRDSKTRNWGWWWER